MKCDIERVWGKFLGSGKEVKVVVNENKTGKVLKMRTTVSGKDWWFDT